MKTLLHTLRAPFAILALATLAGCANPGSKELSRVLRSEGIVAFSPPVGDAGNPTEWNKYGPGAVVDRKGGRSRGRFEISAKNFTGYSDVGNVAMRPEQRSPLGLQQRITLHRESNGSFGTSSLGEQATMLAGSVEGATVTHVEITLGFVWKSMPYAGKTMREWRQRTPIPSGTAVVWAPVIADSLTYTFFTGRAGGGSVKLRGIPGKLEGSGFQSRNGSLVTTHPTFIGFYPLN